MGGIGGTGGTAIPEVSGAIGGTGGGGGGGAGGAGGAGGGGGGGGGGGAMSLIDSDCLGVSTLCVFVFCAIICVKTTHTNSNIIVFFMIIFFA